MHGHVLLEGIVGSTAYGFAHAGSDIDRLGVFAAPTHAFFGLTRPKESHVTTEPDYTWHEIGKWCRLALACNPTAMELVWLPRELYDTMTPFGHELIGIRDAFLSVKAVRNAYLGYATQQFIKMKRTQYKMDMHGTTPEEVKAKRLKNARHITRLLVQAQSLAADRELVIRLADPQWVWDTAEKIVADPDLADTMITATAKFFDGKTALPEEPREDIVEEWLQRLRCELLDKPQDFLDVD